MNELLEHLRLLDEVTLIELLAVTSDEIVDAFLDVIQDRFAELSNYLDEQD